MDAIQAKSLNHEIRNEIVRDIVTHVYAHVDKPTNSIIGGVARQLVTKYPFMSDLGTAPFVSRKCSNN